MSYDERYFILFIHQKSKRFPTIDWKHRYLSFVWDRERERMLNESSNSSLLTRLWFVHQHNSTCLFKWLEFYIEPHTLHTHWNAHGKYLDLLHTLFVVKILLSSSYRVNHSIFKDSPGTCARTSLMGADRCVWSEIFFSLERNNSYVKTIKWISIRMGWTREKCLLYWSRHGIFPQKKIIDSLCLIGYSWHDRSVLCLSSRNT